MHLLNSAIPSDFPGEVSRKTHPNHEKLLAGVTATASQTRKTRWERVQNVAKVFTVTQPEFIQNQRIALIDDVVTTGSTLESCAQILLEKGCREAHIWTLATAL